VYKREERSPWAKHDRSDRHEKIRGAGGNTSFKKTAISRRPKLSTDGGNRGKKRGAGVAEVGGDEGAMIASSLASKRLISLQQEKRHAKEGGNADSLERGTEGRDKVAERAGKTRAVVGCTRL